MTITVGFLVFPGIQLLDLAGPYEIFAALPDCEIHLFWKTREPLACSAGMLFQPTTTLTMGHRWACFAFPVASASIPCYSIKKYRHGCSADLHIVQRWRTSQPMCLAACWR